MAAAVFLAAGVVLTSMKGDNFFPVADGTVKTHGGDRRLRPSTLLRDRPERGEEPEVFRGESDELSSQNPLQDDSTQDDAEAKIDFWSVTGDFIYRQNVGLRVNFTRREQNHSLFRWSTSTLPEQHIPHLMYCWKNTLKITGTLMEKENCRMRGQASQDSFYWTKGHLKDFHGPGRIWRGNNQIQGPKNYGQKWRNICLMHPNARQNKSGLSRNHSLIMPADYVVSASLNLRKKNSKNTPWETLVETWKCRGQQRCLVKTPVNCSGETCRQFITALQFGSQIYSYASSILKFQMQRQQWKIMGTLWQNAGMAAHKSQKQQRGDRRSKEQG